MTRKDVKNIMVQKLMILRVGIMADAAIVKLIELFEIGDKNKELMVLLLIGITKYPAVDKIARSEACEDLYSKQHTWILWCYGEILKIIDLGNGGSINRKNKTCCT